MALGTQNITADFRERQYAAYHEQTPAPSWFRHVSPTYSGPTMITYPDDLNSIEQAEVNAWLNATVSQRPSMLAKCTQRAAIAKITEFIAYYADASYLNWSDADKSSQLAQWRLYLADALLNNKASIPATSDGGGSGSGQPTPPFTMPENTPN